MTTRTIRTAATRCWWPFLLIGLAGCPAAVDPYQAYLAAVEDASVAEPGEIVRDLTPIVPSNEELIWREGPTGPQVKMAVWTDWPGYDETVGQEMPLAIDIWVTAAPQIQDFCRQNGVKPEHLTRRLEQLLGLPPDDGKDRFVELWVDPTDLFRPTPDPEVTDQEAELTFPYVPDYLTVSEDYMTWFNELLAEMYGGDNPYPWTRLGYTYDWGNPFSEVGLSEFIVRKGAVVEIISVTPTLAYCLPGSAP